MAVPVPAAPRLGMVPLWWAILSLQACGTTALFGSDFPGFSDYCVQEDVRWWIFLTGNLGCVLLLAIFFVWENGCFHWSGRAEHLVVSFALLGPYFSSTVLFHMCVWLPEKMRPHQTGQANKSSESVVVEITQLLRLLLVFYIVRSIFEMSLHPGFFETSATRQQTKAFLRMPTLRAKKVVRELDNLLQEIWSLRAGKANHVSVGILGMVLFSWADLTWVVGDASFQNSSQVAATLAQLLAGLYWGFRKAKRQWKVGALVNQVNNIATNIARPAELDNLEHILSAINAPIFVESVNWDIFSRLVKQALQIQMSPLTKAIMIDALQKSGLKAHRKRAEMVLTLLLATQGKDLTELKNLIDGSGTYHNLYKLVYHDIRDRSQRKRLIEHLVEEARKLREANVGRWGIKVVSDIDDTLLCSAGKFPAGVDRRFPKRSVYPGCLTLFRALDEEHRRGNACCNIVFISARPHLYKDVSEGFSYQMFRTLMEEGLLHSLPTLLPGHKRQGLRAMASYLCRSRKSHAWQAVGDRKHKTFCNFRKLYNEYDFVFFGDNGQGDLWSAQHMVSLQRAVDTSYHRRETLGAPMHRVQWDTGRETRLLAALIHEVMPIEESLALEPPPERDEGWIRRLEDAGLFFYKTYVGAALKIHHLHPDLLPPAFVTAIANQAINDFDNVRLMYHEFGRFNQAEDELRADLAAVGPMAMADGLFIEALRTGSVVNSLIHTPSLGSAQSLCIEGLLDSMTEESGWKESIFSMSAVGGVSLPDVPGVYRSDRSVSSATALMHDDQ